MKVFVFGAGASLGSQVPQFDKGVSRRAPLVDELFDTEYEDLRDPFLNPVEHRQSREESAKAGSVERWLTNRWDNLAALRTSKQIEYERAFFGRVTGYIWNVIRSISETYTEDNLYANLVRLLRGGDSDFGFISFNYDLLLDKAIHSNCTELWTFDDYVRNDYIKPHGSVNWFLPPRPSDSIPDSALSEVPSRMRFAASKMLTGDPIEAGKIQYLHPHAEVLQTAQSMLQFGPYSFPLVFMPLTAKHYPMILGFYDSIVHAGKELMARSDEVYFVGYRAADDIIRDLCQSVRPGTVLHVVSRDESTARATMATVCGWQSNFKAGTASGGGFEKFVADYAR